MDLEQILSTIQPFVIMFVALFAAFLTALWVSAVIWTFRDIRSRTRDIFAQILATLLVLAFFPMFPVPGLILYMILRPRQTLSEIYERSLEEETLLQGIEERMACPTCNRRIEEDYVICPTCQTRLKKACSSCGRLLHLRWSICAYCGAAQTTATTAPSLQPEPIAVPLQAPGETPMLAGAPPAAMDDEVEEGAFTEVDAADEGEFETEPESEDTIEHESWDESQTEAVPAEEEFETEPKPEDVIEHKSPDGAQTEAMAEPETTWEDEIEADPDGETAPSEAAEDGPVEEPVVEEEPSDEGQAEPETVAAPEPEVEDEDQG